MRNCLSLRKKEVSVALEDNALVYTYHDDTISTGKIPADKILASEYYSGENGTLNVHFVNKKLDKKLEQGKLSFTGTETECIQIHNKIENYLATLGRPKNLLVFINPNSGKKRAKSVYQRHTERLFRLCNVNAHIIVTSRSKEATDILMEYDISQIDGIIAVGGDGIYNEVITGLIKRQQNDKGLDYNDPDADILPPTIPVGIIPAGSGNTTVEYLHGTDCPETAVLKILLGQCARTNIASLHEAQKLSGYSGLILGFGLFGDMMKDCEKYRWMGPKRYKIIPFGSILRRRTVDVDVSYIQAENGDQRKTRNPIFQRQISLPNAKTTVLASDRTRPSSVSDILRGSQEWKRAKGRVYALDTHPITKVHEGETMVPKFGENALTLCMTEKCSLMKHVDHLTKVRDEKRDCYQYDFVSQFKVTRYRVRLQNVQLTQQKQLEKKFYVNCDGEVIKLTKPEFEVKLHKKVLSIFGSLE